MERAWPLHPKLKAMLEQAADAVSPRNIPLAAVRDGLLLGHEALRRPAVAQVNDRQIPGPRGQLAIRIYRPRRFGALPVVMYFHGGGFALGSIETHDALAREICTRADVVVVSVDYALAPEHKFPAALTDCLAATRWVALHADEFGGDGALLGLAGDSAGGNLAAVTAICLRDTCGPHASAQLLMYPVTDHYSAGMPSYSERDSGYGLTADTMRWFWDMYLDDPSQGDHPHASPNRSANLRGLPPTYMFTAGYDPLRDEGEIFARRLREAAVETTCIRYPDMNHGFVKWTGQIDKADEALNGACAWLKQIFSRVAS